MQKAFEVPRVKCGQRWVWMWEYPRHPPGAPAQTRGGTHSEVSDPGKHQVGKGFGHCQPGSDPGVQQALHRLLSQGCGSPYKLLMTQCHNGYIGQWSLQGPDTLLLGHKATYRAVHLWNQKELARR